jgi:hypothetical protein
MTRRDLAGLALLCRPRAALRNSSDSRLLEAFNPKRLTRQTGS